MFFQISGIDGVDENTPPSKPAFDRNKYRFSNTNTNKMSENGMKLIYFVEFIDMLKVGVNL